MHISPFPALILGVIFGYIASSMARKRGRDPWWWFLGGFLFGVLGLIVLALLPPLTAKKPIKNFNRQSPIPDNPLHSDRNTAYKDQFMQKDWYFLSDAHLKNGPLSYPSLKRAWQTGEILEKTYVWTDGMADWQKIEELPELYGELSLAEV